MRKRTSSPLWLLLIFVAVLLFLGGMHFLSMIGLAAAGGGGFSIGPYYETRRNYTHQSTLEAPQGYIFTGGVKRPFFSEPGNMIGIYMEGERLKSPIIGSLGVYNYVSGEHLYTYDYPNDYPNDPRTISSRLTQEAYYRLYIRRLEDKDDGSNPFENANFCWDKHSNTSGKTTTLCFGERRKRGPMYFAAEYIIIHGEALNEGRIHELFIVDTETAELVKKISLGTGQLKRTSGLTFVHSYKTYKKEGSSYHRDWYKLDLSQLRLIETDEVPIHSGRNKSLFKTKDYYAFQDLYYNHDCATEHNNGRSRKRVVICKTSFVPP